MALAKHDSKQEVYDVADCNKPAERALNRKQIVKTNFSLKDLGARQVHLCKEHYSTYEKKSRTNRKLDSYH